MQLHVPPNSELNGYEDPTFSELATPIAVVVCDRCASVVPHARMGEHVEYHRRTVAALAKLHERSVAVPSVFNERDI